MSNDWSEADRKYYWKLDYCKRNHMNPDDPVWWGAADKRHEETRADRERQRKQNESY